MVRYCVLSWRARAGGPKPGDWQRTIRVQFDWGDGTEDGVERVWVEARGAYRKIFPQIPEDQILEIGAY